MTDIKVSWPIFGLAMFFLASGLGVFFWAVRRPAARYLHATNHLVWSLVAMAPTLLLFSLFPGSSASGNFVGFTVGGAFAAFAAVWYFGSHFGTRGIDADLKLSELRQANATLVSRLATGAGSGPPAADPVLLEQHELRYAVRGRRGREIVILTGNVLDVHAIDVWVSSENTNMQMARFHDRSVSALVRYYGAGRDGDGEPVDDLVADELADCMRQRGKQVVPAGAVVVTSPGMLAASNGVKRLYHVAAVEGQPGAGYRPVAEIARCVTNAVARMDDEAEAIHGARTILFPLLGTGVAGGEAVTIAGRLVSAAAQYIAAHERCRAQRVYFLAYRRSELHHWVAAADACSLLQRIGGSAEALLEPGPIAQAAAAAG
jgi:O-acetyl-ADP-ribose deacetylase (regulator of RNase III)